MLPTVDGFSCAFCRWLSAVVLETTRIHVVRITNHRPVRGEPDRVARLLESEPGEYGILSTV
jgi:hypothetical protein